MDAIKLCILSSILADTYTYVYCAHHVLNAIVQSNVYFEMKNQLG